MNKSEIHTLRVLKEAKDHSATLEDLAKELKVSPRSVERTLKSLREKALVNTRRGVATLALSPKSTLLIRLSNKMQIYKLLADSGEKILPLLLEAKKIKDVARLTGLSSSTIRRSLNSMKETGAVVQNGDGFSINQNYPEVRLLASMMSEEDLSKIIQNKNEEILYRDSDKLIKRVPIGTEVENGARTAFSVFSSFGMDLRSEFDYYIVPTQKIEREDAFVHALVTSTTKLERTHCAIFYAVNRNRMDITKIRDTCEAFRVGRFWTDIEAYVRKELVEDQDLFLPWKEFSERCKIFNVDPNVFLPARLASTFFTELGHMLTKKVSVYLIGGENMRIKGMKQATKDIDFVTRSGSSSQFLILLDVLVKKMGYHKLGLQEISISDAKLNPRAILEHPSQPRIDVFSRIICNKFVLLDSMLEDSTVMEFGNLVVLLATDEDVFLLKSITDREADDVDMVQILKKSENFDWKRVLDRLYEQERVTKQHYCFGVFDTIAFIQDSSRMKIPIFHELLNHTTDQAILKVLKRFGKQSVKEIVGKIGNVEDYLVRNRLNRLALMKIVKKQKLSGRIFFSKKN